MYSVSIRNSENVAVPRMNPATLAPLIVLMRRMPIRINGSEWRSSHTTKPTNRTADAAKNDSAFADSQPSWPARVIAYTKDDSPEVTSTAPSASKDLTDASRLSRSRIGVRMNAAMPIGTLTKKIHDQLSADVRTPPISTPAAAPKPPTAPQTPSAMLRSRPSVNVVDRIDSAAGVITAAPSPWNERAAIRDPSDQARPASSEESENRTMPARKSRRRPSRSAARPPRSRKPPKKRA